VAVAVVAVFTEEAAFTAEAEGFTGEVVAEFVAVQ
jgi:hypothetical protein